MRLVFVPLLLLLFLINIGYTISAVAVMDRPNVAELDRDLLVHGGHGRSSSRW